jgi:AcrB/AcrD/AcrF family
MIRMPFITDTPYYNEVKAGGIGTTEAMFRAASQRMRPLLMTALSACIGLLPAAVSTGIGSQVQRPLATVVVGGMFIGPIILLVVVRRSSACPRVAAALDKIHRSVWSRKGRETDDQRDSRIVNCVTTDQTLNDLRSGKCGSSR